MNKFFKRAAKAVVEGISPPPPGRKALCGKGFECLANKKHGFTLAEILISLLILGVIASLTIPSLIQNTHKKEEQVKVKKGLSMINQAIAMDKALTGNDLSQYTDRTELITMFKKRLSVVDSDRSSMMTQDGLVFEIQAFAPEMPPEDVSFNPNDSLSNSNWALEITLSTKGIGFWTDLSSFDHYYLFHCSYDRCVPDEGLATFMNAKDPTKLKRVSGKWVEQ